MQALKRVRAFRLPLRWLFLLAVTMLGGCATTLLPQPEVLITRTYVLEWSGPQPASHLQAGGPSLLVSSMRAASGYESSDMAYVRTPHQLEYFARHRWVDAPSRMLEPMLLQAAAASGLFSSVSEAGSGTQAQMRLDSRLLHLRQVCRLQPSELQLAVRLTLVDVASAQQIGSRVISVKEPIKARSPAAGVDAANEAVQKLVSGTQDFLLEYLARERE